MQVDPVTLEVLNNALTSAAEEMHVILARTAASPHLREGRDCSTAIFTRDGKLVTQAGHIPLYLGVMPAAVEAVLAEMPLQALHAGDAVICNDPYTIGSYLPGICLVKPVYTGNTPLAFLACLAHHADIGGSAPGSLSTATWDLYSEGVRIPPLKILDRNQANRNLMRLLAGNVRTPGEFQSDLQAQLTALYRGEKRLQELARKYGTETTGRYMENIITHTAGRMQRVINSLPRGSFHFEEYLEGDGATPHQLKISVNVGVNDGLLVVDFTGTSSQARGPLNTTPAITRACAYYAAKATLAPDLPDNHGIAAVVEVVAPPGTLVNPHFPAPVAHAASTAQRVTEVILGALAGMAPDLVTAAGTAGTGSIAIGGPASDKQLFIYKETCGGGQGAAVDSDGMDGVHVHLANTRNIPVEILEQNYPLRVEKYALRPDSGGPGKFRGGCGLERQIRILSPEAMVTVSAERSIYGPWGLAGGKAGAPASCTILWPGAATPVEYRPAKFTGRVPRDTLITLQTAGGGGYGNPRERDPQKVRRDVEKGLVSPDQARKEYGVDR